MRLEVRGFSLALAMLLLGAPRVAGSSGEPTASSLRSPSSGPSASVASSSYQSRVLSPPLLSAAEEAGVWSSEGLSFEMAMNPFYLRGDFDGDGKSDVAVWIRRDEDGRRGLVIVHGSLDAVHLFGAGEALPPELSGAAGFREDALRVDTWRVLPAGYVAQHPYTTNEQLGVEGGGVVGRPRAGKPFRFERETLELHYTGKSAFALYFSDGKYHAIWTAD